VEDSKPCTLTSSAMLPPAGPDTTGPGGCCGCSCDLAAASDVSGPTGPQPVRAFDICIVGAGPHALAVLSALRRVPCEGAGSTAPHPQVCVIDPAGAWLHEWDAGFSALDIEYLRYAPPCPSSSTLLPVPHKLVNGALVRMFTCDAHRSPAWAHPDACCQEALVDFAQREGRTSEWKCADFEGTSLHGMTKTTTGSHYSNPSTKLFRAFCETLISTLPHALLHGTVIDISKRCPPTGEVGCNYEVTFKSPTSVHSCITTTHVVMALGARGCGNIPAPFANLVNDGAGRIFHTADARRLTAMKSKLCKADTVLVIGGGLSAVQAAFLAVGCGVGRAVLCSRKPLVTRHYDLPLEWMDDRLGRQQGRNRDRVARYYSLPPRDRIKALKEMRGGGSVPPDYMETLSSHERAGRLEVKVGQVWAADATGEGVDVRFDDGSTLKASYVVLGTGFVTDSLQIPLFKSLADRFQLPIEEGLPVLNDDLLWHENEKITVVGALAAGSLGPCALNLVGARKGGAMFATRFRLHGSFHRKKKYEPDPFSLAP